MVAVALDVADPAVPEVHVDAAPAGAHVAGGGLDLVGNDWRGMDASIAVRGSASWFLRVGRATGLSGSGRSVKAGMRF
jgi:hypothetical protein